MITTLKQLNRILVQNVFLSKHIDHSSIYAPLKSYIGSDWYKLYFSPNKTDSKYSEAFLFSNEALKSEYCKHMFENKKTYDNELVMKIIKWNPKYEGEFHGHNGNHCYYKILDGNLRETINNETIKKDFFHGPNTIGYISDNIGQHKIKNFSNDYAYSLHIYFKNDHPDFNHLLFEEQAKTSN